MKQAEQQAGMLVATDLLPLSVHKDTNFNDFQSELCPPRMGPTTFADVSCTAASHMGQGFKGIS